ncbi:MAG: Asp-tRNA(Asn) amidotransferase subunit GatC [Methanomicrobiales archaeon]
MNLKIEKEAEEILEKFSKVLENIPELEETHYIVDNINLTREDLAEDKNPDKILRNAHIDEDGNLIAEKGKWVK